MSVFNRWAKFVHEVVYSFPSPNSTIDTVPDPLPADSDGSVPATKNGTSIAVTADSPEGSMRNWWAAFAPIGGWYLVPMFLVVSIDLYKR